MVFPEKFISQINELLGEASPAFFEAMQQSPSVSVKINRRKCTAAAECGFDKTEPVAWCPSGFYLPSRPVFTLNPLLHAGVFYVQDASSMIYESIIERIAPAAFDTGAPLRVLDLCAAPGGKTTSMINALPDGTVVVANEFVGTRAAVLKENLTKWGYPDIFVTNSPTSQFAKMPETFDIVAVDAPCSGEGMMRKEEVALTQWSEGLIRQCAALQRDILTDAFAALKPGGFLIYSTCTFNRQEDENNLRFLVEELGCAPVDMEFPAEWGILPGIDTPYPCLRFMPHATRGEGLFVAVVRKEGEYAAAPSRRAKSFAETLKANTRVIAAGIERTTVKGRDTVPVSEAVLACDYDRSLPEADLDQETALSYLRHEALRLPDDTPRGYVCVRYAGHPLGIVKNLGNRANNLYPQHWKIRMKS